MVNYKAFIIGLCKRFAKYITVGAISSLTYLCVLYILTDIAGIYYMVSAAIGIIVNEVINYLGYNFWAFGDRKSKNHLASTGKYLIAFGVHSAVFYPLLYTLTEYAGLWYLMSTVIAMGIATVVKFTVCWRWIWKSTSACAPTMKQEI